MSSNIFFFQHLRQDTKILLICGINLVSEAIAISGQSTIKFLHHLGITNTQLFPLADFFSSVINMSLQG